MDKSLTLKNYLDHSLEQVRNGPVPIHVPARKGLRRMIQKHVFHDHSEIFLQLKGSTLFHFPTESFELVSGEILIVPPELPHAEEIRRDRGEFETLVITPSLFFLQCHISRDSNMGVPTIYYYETVQGKDSLTISQYADLIIQRGTPSDSYASSISRGLTMALLAAVRSLLSQCDEIPEGNSKIAIVKNTVLSHYHHNSLTVGQLAQQLNCTADYLSWLFHRETGVTLKRFINQHRLKKAADLLKNTDYTISEIAWNCGFKNPAYFSRVFSKEYTLPPREFR